MASIYRATAEPAGRKFIPTISSSAWRSKFRIVTYNILADAYLVRPGRIESYANDLTGVQASDLVWESRLPRLLSELEGYGADIVCLQEVEREAFSRDLVPGLAKLGYFGAGYADRDSDAAVAAMPQGSRSNGVAIFCKSSTFKVIATRNILFSEEVDRLMPEASGDLRGRLEGFLNPNGPDGFNTSGQGVALLALLKHQDTGKLVVVCSTHLYFDFRFNDTKSVQALMIHRALDRFVSAEADGASVPVMVCGDFNSMPEGHVSRKLIAGATKATEVTEDPSAAGGVYRLFRTGCLAREHPEHPIKTGSSPSLDCDLVSPLVPMVSAYGGEIGASSEPETTSRDLHYISCLDYIWLGATVPSDGPIEEQDKVVPVVIELLELPFESGKSVAFGPIPDSNWPSDHLAIGATVVM